MADLEPLGVEVRLTGAKEAGEGLDKVTASGQGTEKAVNELKAAIAELTSTLKAEKKELQDAASAKASYKQSNENVTKSIKDEAEEQRKLNNAIADQKIIARENEINARNRAAALLEEARATAATSNAVREATTARKAQAVILNDSFDSHVKLKNATDGLANSGTALTGVTKGLGIGVASLVGGFISWQIAIDLAVGGATALVNWLKKQQDETYAAKASLVAIEPAVIAYKEAVDLAAGANDNFARSSRQAAVDAKQMALDQIKASQAIIVAKSAEIEASQDAASASGQSEFGAVLGSQGSRTISEEQKKLIKATNDLNEATKKLLESDKKRIQSVKEETAELAIQAKQVNMTAGEKIKANAQAKADSILGKEATDEAKAAAAALIAQGNAYGTLVDKKADAAKAAREHSKELTKEAAEAKKAKAEILDLVDALQKEEQKVNEFLYKYGQDVSIQPIELVDQIKQSVVSKVDRFTLENSVTKLKEDLEKGASGYVSEAKRIADANKKVAETFLDISDAGYSALSAMKNGDWVTAAKNIKGVVDNLTTAFKSGNTNDKIAGIAGLADIAGQVIGGKTGNVISGVASGVAAGASLGPLGAIAGGAIGLIGSLFGHAKAKAQAKAEKAEQDRKKAEEERVQALQIEISTLKGTGQWLKAATLQRQEEIKSIAASNVAAYQANYNLQLAAKFRNLFYTEEENFIETRGQLTKELATLGLNLDDFSRDKFKELVNQGGQLGAALLDLMEPFDQVTKGAENAAKAIADAAKAVYDQGVIDFQVQNQLDANEAVRVERLNRLIDTYGTKAEAHAAIKKANDDVAAAAEAWTSLSTSITETLPGLLKAGDVMGILGAKTRLYYADPANASYIRDQTNFSTGGFNVGGANALFAKVQAQIAKDIYPQVAANSLDIKNAVQVLQSLADTFDRQFDYGTPGFTNAMNKSYSGGIGQMPGLQGALNDYALVSSTTDSYGRPGTGYGKDVNDYLATLESLKNAFRNPDGGFTSKNVNEIIAAEKALRDFEDATAGFADFAKDAASQLERINYVAMRVNTEAVNQINSVFTQLEALGAVSTEAAEPLARVVSAMDKFQNITELLQEGVNNASSSYVGSGQGQAASLVAQAAALAGAVLTTQDAYNMAKKLAADSAFSDLSGTGVRDIALMFDGLKAFDADSLLATFSRLSTAVYKGSITQEQYTNLVNKSFDVYEGIADEADNLKAAFRSLADELLLDKGLTSLTDSGQLSEAKRQLDETYARGEDVSAILKNYLQIAMNTAESQNDYNTVFNQEIGRLRNYEAPGYATNRFGANADASTQTLADIQALLENILISTNANLGRTKDSQDTDARPVYVKIVP